MAKGLSNIIPKEAKIGLGVAVAGGLLYWVYKKLNKSPEEEKQERLEKEAEKVKDPDTGKVIDCSNRLTYAKSWYDSQAEILYTAMFGPGTDESTIFTVFNKVKTDCDVAQIIASFGLRRQEFYFKTFDLRWFLKDELDAKEIAEINRILRTKGIKYQF